MSKIKNDLMKEIEAKVAKNKAIRAKVASKDRVNDIVEAFIKDIEDAGAMMTSTKDWFDIGMKAVELLSSKVRIIDYLAKIDVTWLTEPNSGMKPQVNSVIVTWSKAYVEKHKCDTSRTIDAASIYIDKM